MPELSVDRANVSGNQLVLHRSQANRNTGASAVQTIPLSYYWGVLRRQLWKVAVFVAVSLSLVFFVSKHLTPLYEATATVHVNPQGSRGIVGEDSLQMRDLDTDTFLLTQIKLVQSSSVLRPVLTKYHLKNSQLGNKTPAFGSSDVPVKLDGLKVSRPSNTYLLEISYRSPDPVMSAKIANAIADSYIEHAYDIRIHSSRQLTDYTEHQIGELRAKMEKSSAALARFERDLNVINPEEKTNILSSRLLQLNTEYTGAEGDRDRKQAAFESVKNGSLEAASHQDDAMQNITDRLNEANQKFAEVRAHVGPSHPEYKKASMTVEEVQRQFDDARTNLAKRVEVEYLEAVNREHILQKQVADTKAEFDLLNARSFEYRSLQQEADADKKIYEELFEKVKEARINAGFEGDSLRLADLAGPSPQPVFPKTTLYLFITCLLSLTLGISVVLLADMLDNTVRTAEQAKRLFGIDVVGLLPMNSSFNRYSLLLPARSSGSAVKTRRVDALQSQTAHYWEAIRSLRISLLLVGPKRRIRSILVTSAMPGEGKTNSAVHLAIVHAEQHHRTLLLDADLRRPMVHKYFRLGDDHKGIIDTLLEEGDWRNVVTDIEDVPNLSVITAGRFTQNGTDFIGRELHRIVQEAAKDYDLVIVDSPPMLTFAEPLQMATSVDGVLIIAAAGHTSRSAILGVLSTLRRLNASICGLVLNKVASGTESYSYYEYKKYKSDSRSAAR